MRCLYSKTVTVKVARPPSWEGLSREGRRERRRAMIAEMRAEERRAAREREESGIPLPSEESIVKRDPRSRPNHPKPKTRKRKWASGTPEQMARFRAAYRLMLPVYRAASLSFRETGVMPAFPAGTYPPRIMYAFVES